MIKLKLQVLSAFLNTSMLEMTLVYMNVWFIWLNLFDCDLFDKFTLFNLQELLTVTQILEKVLPVLFKSCYLCYHFFQMDSNGFFGAPNTSYGLFYAFYKVLMII